MKHSAPFTRTLAFFTAALLVLTGLPLTALAGTGRLGEQLYSLSRPIAQNAVFSTQALQGDAEQTPAMVTHSPGGDIQPVAAYAFTENPTSPPSPISLPKADVRWSPQSTETFSPPPPACRLA